MIPDRNLRVAFVVALDLVKRRQLEMLRRTDPSAVVADLASLPIPGDKLQKLRTLEWPAPQLAFAHVEPIADLAGIERCRSLDTCRIAVASGTNLARLAKLRLQELAISGGDVADLEFVTELRSLRALAVVGPIPDLAPVGELDALESLSLDGVIADDVTPLLALRGLTQLRLRWRDGVPGPPREMAQRLVDALPEAIEIDVVWPCGDVRPSREGMRRAHNRELEDRIRGEPDDPDAYLVYADWLQAANDPFGQLIIYDHLLEAAPSRELAELRRTHLQTHRRRFLGDLHDSAAYTWRLGYIRRAEVTNADELAALRRAPAARFLSSLCLHVAAHGIGVQAGQVLRTLLGAGAMPLRELEVHTRRAPVVTTVRVPPAISFDASPLWSRFPRLCKLIVDGPIELGEIVLPEATDVEVRNDDGLHDRAVDAISGAEWPRLERLVIAGVDYHVPSSVLAAAGTPDLRRLRIEVRWPEQLCEALASARVVDQLAELEVISPEGIGNAGARALVRARARFAHLDVFDVTVGKVNPADAKALGEMLVKRTPE